MNHPLPLAQMSTAEKLEVMEAIWADLTREEQRVESPAWHEQILRRRATALQAGGEVPMDWDAAKQRLRDLRA